MDTEKIIANFDRLSSGYNHSALRFFPFCADRLVTALRPRSGQKVLDVATGTGVVAMACAQAVGSQGRVLAVDLSAGMLAQAEKSFHKLGLDNIDILTMDAAKLDFKNNYFDAVACSFAIFFLNDMMAALKEWKRVLKPEGKLIFSCFAEDAFQPLLQRLQDDLLDAGVNPEQLHMSSQRLQQKSKCMALMHEAGLRESTVEQIQIGYHLNDANEWWNVVWNSGMRNLVTQLPPHEIAAFQQRHVSGLQDLASADGLWLDVPVYLCLGKK